MWTFLWVMHLNVGYNNDNIFLCHGGKVCVRKQPSYTDEQPIIFRGPPSNSVFLLFQGTCRGFLSNILS